MTATQKALQRGTNASLSKRGVSVTCDANPARLLALVQVVDDKARAKLQITDEDVTHVLHITRISIAAASISYKSVAVIARGDSAQTYRVKYIKDDPQLLNVLFHCAAA